MAYTVAVVDRAVTLLETLANHPDAGVTQLAHHTDATKSQVFRLLHTLEARGYVRKDPATKTYRLGYRTIYLGHEARSQATLNHVAGPILDELAEDTDENVHLVVRDGLRSVCVALRESTLPLRLYAEVGRPGPLHAGGGSVLLLAYAPPQVRRQVLAGPLEVYTPATVTEPSRLEELLRTIRANGYHVATNDLDEGAFSIAAPVRDHDGTIVAALSVAGPISRFTESRAAAHRVKVVRAAERLSAELGHADRVAG